MDGGHNKRRKILNGFGFANFHYFEPRPCGLDQTNIDEDGAASASQANWRNIAIALVTGTRQDDECNGLFSTVECMIKENDTRVRRMLPLLALNAIPILLVGVAWWTQRKDGKTMPKWRRFLFMAALVANTVSSIALLGFLLGTFSGALGAQASGLILMAMLGVGLIGFVLAVFGKRISRLLLVGNGLLVVVFWYLAGMATSI
jgi:hypothetical protein